jgi:hypothetical protein
MDIEHECMIASAGIRYHLFGYSWTGRYGQALILHIECNHLLYLFECVLQIHLV